MTLPLASLKIVVTRPRDQAIQLVRGIEQAGGIPVSFPLLEITAVPYDGLLCEQMSRLAQFDLAIFISPNAVQYGIAAIRAACIPLSPGTSLSAGRGELRFAAVGQGSAKALRELGIANVIAPTERFDSEGLLALPELQNMQGWRVMIFRGDGGRELLGDTLKARGATVEYAECYRRSKPQHDGATLLAAQPDAITVTSSEALEHLRQLLDERAWQALRNVPLFVIHPRIAALAEQQGWQQVVMAGSGDEAMLSALTGWAGRKGGK